MKQAVAMPALSDTMNVGRLSKWLKRPGDPVHKGEAIAEVETDKAVMEVEAFYDGYLSGPLAPIDTDLPLGAPIAYIVDSAADAGSATPTVAKPAPAQSPAATPVTRTATAPAAAQPTGARLSPYARAQAEKHKTAELDEGPPYRLERPSAVRDAVAHNMIATAATPTFHLTALLPIAPLQALAKTRNLSLSLLLARACALTIKAHPLFNAAYTPEGLAHRDRIDIGIAVEIPEGLVTPILRDVAQRPIADLAADWASLRDKVKTRRLAAQDYRGATFYVSNLGNFPVVRSFDSIIPSGASAILSIGAAQADGAMFTLACDHRVVFGADGARFLATLNDLLTAPATLVG